MKQYWGSYNDDMILNLVTERVLAPTTELLTLLKLCFKILVGFEMFPSVIQCLLWPLINKNHHLEKLNMLIECCLLLR